MGQARRRGTKEARILQSKINSLYELDKKIRYQKSLISPSDDVKKELRENEIEYTKLSMEYRDYTHRRKL